MPSFSNAINATKAAPARLSARAAFRTTCPVAHAPVAKALRVAGPVRVSALAVGDKIPSDASLAYFDAEGNMNTMDMAEACASKKVVLFAVPGAFTPTCSLKHLPGFIEKADEIKAKGVDLVGCVSVNDAFVMDAWGKSVGADNKVRMSYVFVLHTRLSMRWQGVPNSSTLVSVCT
mmetsp:Transcript_50556/g.94184  ORF Transcript_50556/g.94184 Transcript_50556/m.94184 type:complete len:176 (+) Transcript_50556:101-628(+)